MFKASILTCLFFLYVAGLSTTYAATSLCLKCPERAMMTMTRFHYGLTTLTWAEQHFQVAAGIKHYQTSEGIPFRVTNFRNGDDLVYFPQTHIYVFFYANSSIPVLCEKGKTFTSHAVTLPYYHK